jgi:hypothetical protein
MHATTPSAHREVPVDVSGWTLATSRSTTKLASPSLMRLACTLAPKAPAFVASRASKSRTRLD